LFCRRQSPKNKKPPPHLKFLFSDQIKYLKDEATCFAGGRAVIKTRNLLLRISNEEDAPCFSGLY
jgi:hypothetical protein